MMSRRLLSCGARLQQMWANRLMQAAESSAMRRTHVCWRAAPLDDNARQALLKWCGYFKTCFSKMSKATRGDRFQEFTLIAVHPYVLCLVECVWQQTTDVYAAALCEW